MAPTYWMSSSAKIQFMETLKEQLEVLGQRLGKIKQAINPEAKHEELLVLEARAAKSDFWEDQDWAKRVMQEIDEIKRMLETLTGLDKEISDAISVASEIELQGEVEGTVKRVGREIDRLELTTFLSGKYDRSDAILSIHSGQGGTEAMDWVSMLFRMYLRFCERKSWNTQVVEETPGEEAGFKSVTLFVSGPFAYGYLKGEAGTHRLVRQSPFNADKLRQTSFALVEVLPKIEEKDALEIKENELEWQFFRSSSQGGQNVQKVSTAVRLTHRPTGVVVTAQSERYQQQNRKIALSLLQAKLWEKKVQEAQKEKKELKGEYKPAAWGTQIRSYVLHPYHMVKDLRTGVEIGNTEAVLDGDLDAFIEAEVKGIVA